MIGGSLMAIFNARIAFRIIGVFAGIVAIVYAAIYYLFIRKDEIKNPNKENKETKEAEENNVLNGPINQNDKSGDIETDDFNKIEDKNDIEMSIRRERCSSITSTISHISANLSLSHPI